LNICLIPARGGSKRIPRKNIRDFHGKPMIAWSIQIAISSNIFDDIIVSTDDNEIARIARLYGAKVPFMRPSHLADDYTNTSDVIAHACEWATENKMAFNNICCLYATSPFLKSSDLVKAYSFFNTGKWKYVFSIGEHSSSPYRSFEKTENGGVKMLFPEYFTTRSQDLTKTFYDAGMFYIATSKTWKEKSTIFDETSFPYLISSKQIQDIDTQEDWERAELLGSLLL
jgi:pseudaminic acid cytidylyltransferase